MLRSSKVSKKSKIIRNFWRNQKYRRILGMVLFIGIVYMTYSQFFISYSLLWGGHTVRNLFHIILLLGATLMNLVHIILLLWGHTVRNSVHIFLLLGGHTVRNLIHIILLLGGHTVRNLVHIILLLRAAL